MTKQYENPGLDPKKLLAQEMANYTEKMIEEEYGGSTNIWTKERADEFRNIPIEELLYDEYFLNAKGWLWEKNAEIILDLWEERKKRPIRLAIILGSIGNGKTVVMSILSWLLWFELTCLYDKDSPRTIPQDYFSIRPESWIAIVALSKTVEKAKDITFTEVKNSFINGFNRDYFPFNPHKKTRLEILRNNTLIFPNTATQAGILGYSVYCLSGNQKIILSDGNQVSLKELENCGELNVKGFDIKSKQFIDVKAKDVIKTGRKEVFEVKMEDGSIIECTEDHPFLVHFLKDDSFPVYYSYKYVPLKNLKSIDFGGHAKDDILFGMSGVTYLKSIKSLGVQDVFDVIDSETNNFILDSGIIVHNSAAIDEAAFLEVIEDSKRGEEEGIYDQAESVYNATQQRMRSRFRHKDKGLIVMVSSVNHPDDYVMRKAKEAYQLDDSEIYCSLLPEWRVKPTHVYFSSNKFFYFDTDKLEIIKDDDEVKALDENYVETEPHNILFGTDGYDVDDDPNDKLLNDMRKNKQLVKEKETELEGV